MKKYLFKSFLFLLLPILSLGQSSTNFKEKFNLSNGGLVYKIRQCKDGDYTVLFVKDSSGVNAIARLNPYGTIKWCKEFTPNLTDDFTLDSLGNAYITDVDPSLYDSVRGIMIIKIDSLGNTLWSKSYGDSIRVGYHFIDYSSDGSIYFASLMVSPYSPGYQGIHLFKIDMNGNLIWDRIAKDPGLNSNPIDIRVVDDNRIAIVGDIAVVSGTESLDLIFDKNGNLVSSAKIDCPANFRLIKIQRFKNKGIILTGSINETTSSGTTQFPLIVAVDSSNNFLWAKKYHSSDPRYNSGIFDLAQLNDSSYAASYSNYKDSTTSFCAVMHIDASGASDWAKSYENRNSGYLNSIIRSKNDNGFTTAGSFENYHQVIIIKADSIGRINACSDDSIFTLSSGSVYMTLTPYAVLDSGCLTGPVTVYSTSYYLTDSTICNITSGCNAYTTVYDSTLHNFTLTVDTATAALATGYHWDFGDGTSSNLATPSHIYTHDSLYNVCMKVYHASGDSCSYCHIIGIDSSGNIVRNSGFTINVQNAIAAGISEPYSGETKISIYPNPTNGQFNVFISSPVKNGSVEIYNSIGTLVDSRKIKDQQNAIELTNEPNGLYFIKVMSDGKIVGTEKIIKE